VVRVRRADLRLPAWAPGLLLALALSLPAWAPFLHPRLEVGRLLDGDQHLAKAYSLAQLLGGGERFPRWTPDLYGGYGYPTFVFYAPATYYVLAALAALPATGLGAAYQVAGASAAAVLVAGAYALGWTLWRNGPAALVAAGAVAYAPYALPTNLFLRGAVPEVAGLALLVWLLCAVTLAWRAPPGAGRHAVGGWYVLAALCTWGLLLTHNVSAVAGAVLVPLWLGCLWLWRPNPGALLGLLGAAVVGALGSAFFWLPALSETGLVQVERMYRGNLHYRNWFLTWPGVHGPLWGLPERSPWTVGAPIDLHPVYPHALYGAPKAGLWQSLLVLGGAGATAGWLAVSRRAARCGDACKGAPGRGPLAPSGSGARLAVLSSLVGALLAVLLYAQSFDWALPLWEGSPALRAVQAPYRLLGPAAIFGALAAGGAVALWCPSWGRVRAAWGGAVLLVAFLAWSGTAGRPLPLAADGEPSGAPAGGVAAAIARQRAQPGTTASTDEFLPRTADFATWHEGQARGFWLLERVFPEASWLAGRVQVWEGQGALHDVSGGGLWTAARVTAGPSGAALAFHQLAFPGWRVTIDGQPAALQTTAGVPAQALRPGLLLVDVPPGRHEVAIRFGPDGVALGAATVSLLNLVAGAGWGLWTLRRRRAALLGAGALVLLLAGWAWLAPRRLARFTAPAVAGVEVNLADAVLAGQAQRRSPTGEDLGPERFLDVRPLTVLPADRPQRDAGPRTRRLLFAHAPSEVAVELTVPRGALFQSGLVLDPVTWEEAQGDGVRFLVGLTPLGGAETVLLDATVHPRGRGEQRRWLDVAADLRPWVGQRVRLSLRTEPRQDPLFDRSGWGEPLVVRVDDLTADRLLRSTAELQERVLRP
jgi:hypothetical protein